MRLRRAVFSDTPPAQSLLNALEAKQVELTAETQKVRQKQKSAVKKSIERSVF